MKIRSLLLLLLNFVLVQSWDCGSGEISTFFALIVSIPISDREYVNNCCLMHDKQYDAIEAKQTDMSYYTSDVLFKRCLEQSQYQYTQTVVTYVYYTAVQANSFIQEKYNNIKCTIFGC